MKIIINNIQKAECFAAIFQHIKCMSDNINLMFETDRLYVQSMDQARVSIFEIVIPSTWFDSYTIANPINLGVNSSILYKILNARDKTQIMQMDYDIDDEDRLNIHFTNENIKEMSNTFDKHFEIPLVDIETELLGIIELDYQAEITFPSTYFASIINQLKMFGDSMEIECSEEHIILYATSIENGKMRVDIKIDDLTAFSILEGDELKLSFSLMYLHNICMFNKLAKDIELKMSTNFPMCIQYDLGEGARIKYFLAPKIQDDD